MYSLLVNTGAVLIGAVIGLLFKRVIKKEYCDSVLKAMGIVVLIVGINGVISNMNILSSDYNFKYGSIVVIFCIGLGTFIGELLKLDTHINNLALKVEKKINRGKIAEGLVTSTILYCVGAMAIIGSLEVVVDGNHNTILIKSIIDGVTSIALASTLGFGVVLSSASVFIYQGLLLLVFHFLLSGIDTGVLEEIIVYVSMVGYVLVAGIGFNLIFKEKIKIVNILPAILIAIIVGGFVIWLG